MASDAAVLKLSATNANSTVRTHLLTARVRFEDAGGLRHCQKVPNFNKHSY